MRMFEHIDRLEPMCKDIGFESFVLDDTNSLMSYNLPNEVFEGEEEKPNRNQVHVGSEEFKHLQEFDMNKICARVTVFAKKPE